MHTESQRTAHTYDLWGQIFTFKSVKVSFLQHTSRFLFECLSEKSVQIFCKTDIQRAKKTLFGDVLYKTDFLNIVHLTSIHFLLYTLIIHVRAVYILHTYITDFHTPFYRFTTVPQNSFNKLNMSQLAVHG